MKDNNNGKKLIDGSEHQKQYNKETTITILNKKYKQKERQNNIRVGL